MVMPPNFVQFTDALGVVYGLNVSAVCQWQYRPAEPDTEDREGCLARLIVTTTVIEFFHGRTADYFYTHLKGHSKEWIDHD